MTSMNVRSPDSPHQLQHNAIYHVTLTVWNLLSAGNFRMSLLNLQLTYLRRRPWPVERSSRFGSQLQTLQIIRTFHKTIRDECTSYSSSYVYGTVIIIRVWDRVYKCVFVLLLPSLYILIPMPTAAPPSCPLFVEQGACYCRDPGQRCEAILVHCPSPQPYSSLLLLVCPPPFPAFVYPSFLLHLYHDGYVKATAYSGSVTVDVTKKIPLQRKSLFKRSLKSHGNLGSSRRSSMSLYLHLLHM